MPFIMIFDTLSFPVAVVSVSNASVCYSAGRWIGRVKVLSVLFCSLAVLNPRVGHTMDVLSPFIPVLSHSD